MPNFSTPRICAYCNQPYTPHHSQQKYCGARCSLAMKIKQNKESHARQERQAKAPKVHPQRICLVCKQLFPPRRAHQKYCSTACSRQADSDNKKALYAKFRKAAGTKSEPVPVPENLPNDSEFATGKKDRCTLCRKPVTRCKCVCTWCGGPKWYVNGWLEWAHHTCNKSYRAANANSNPAVLEVQRG